MAIRRSWRTNSETMTASRRDTSCDSPSGCNHAAGRRTRGRRPPRWGCGSSRRAPGPCPSGCRASCRRRAPRRAISALGTGAAGGHVGRNHLVHQRLIVGAAEGRVRYCDFGRLDRRLELKLHGVLLLLRFGSALAGAALGGYGGLVRRQALAAHLRSGLQGRTDYHAAAFRARVPAADQQQIAVHVDFDDRRFSMVRFLTPMWPDMRLPLNTRPGVWRWPIEPARDATPSCREISCRPQSCAASWCRQNPCPPWYRHSDNLPHREHVDLELDAGRPRPRLRPSVQAEFLRGIAGRHVGLGKMPGLGLRLRATAGGHPR